MGKRPYGRLPNAKIHYGRRICIPTVYEYRESNPGAVQVKVNLQSLEGSPMHVVKQLLELGFDRQWFKSGSQLIGKLVIEGVRRCWDCPQLRAKLRAREEGK